MTMVGRCCLCAGDNCFNCTGPVPTSWEMNIATPMGYSIPLTKSTDVSVTTASRIRECHFERQYHDISGVGSATSMTKFKRDSNGDLLEDFCLWGFIDGVAWQSSQHYGYRVDGIANDGNGKERDGQTPSAFELYEPGKNITGDLTSATASAIDPTSISYNNNFPEPAIEDRPVCTVSGDIVLTPPPVFPSSGIVTWKHGSRTLPTSVFAGTWSTGRSADWPVVNGDQTYNTMGMRGRLFVSQAQVRGVPGIPAEGPLYLVFELGWKGRFTQQWNNWLEAYPNSLALGTFSLLTNGHVKMGERGYEAFPTVPEFNDAITEEMIPTGISAELSRYLGSFQLRQGPYTYAKVIDCTADFSGTPVTLPLVNSQTLGSMDAHEAVGITNSPTEVTVTPIF